MEVIIIGDGGHSQVIQEAIASGNIHEIIAILDDKYQLVTNRNNKVYGPITSIDKLLFADVKVIIAIGNNQIRKQFVENLLLTKSQYLSIIHKTAVVSPSATIGEGTIVMPHAVINARAQIGSHSIINTGTIIEHDVNIGDYAHVSPNATITGNVSIGEGVHIGASATVIPGVTVGDWTVIGAGSTVIHPIPAGSTAVGSPTRLLK